MARVLPPTLSGPNSDHCIPIDFVFNNCEISLRAFNTSMEIFVQASSRKVLTGKNIVISEAFFIFVAVGEDKKACNVPSVNPVTLSDKKLYREALTRKESSVNTK